jgi:nicotinate phosphoribosyltransferase
MPCLRYIAAYAQSEIETFWEEYTRIDNPHIYKVDLSDGLYALKTDMIKQLRGDKN